ncbi:MAG: helix-turn-helix domain-containing protein [Anaerolineae bacterium]|jgi:excisionase family DNA binding protein|nr:helix-turn-helix domain-containing protein [Anaerolineae bacterium]MBT3712441.1 helix-turn-helix domain-containing protein [Anaerolineae bacterium]MBT4310465.1 helix-turn-helix domain-containing protein [Anaerolineae bacterium]MBT4457756.1 helix-turn-helix domain-containing protein [Anaerolineae bacterium]MBT7015959.1 helix-turn-helix domain-containing protein [Anaerolineae bacterium]
MNKKNTNDWLSLSDVARMLGVHSSTVRAWADQGVLPVYRTEGGHRRFLQDEINLWMQTSRQKKEVDPERALRDVLKRIRFKIGENQLESEKWYQKLDNEARLKYRMSGKNLMQSLASYLSAEGEDAIAEARSLGYEYASRGRRYGLSIIDATCAFLFFRNALLEAMIAVYLDARVSDTESWGDMLSRIHAFTDQTMLSLMETYQAFEKNNR